MIPSENFAHLRVVSTWASTKFCPRVYSVRFFSLRPLFLSVLSPSSFFSRRSLSVFLPSSSNAVLARERKPFFPPFSPRKELERYATPDSEASHRTVHPRTIITIPPAHLLEAPGLTTGPISEHGPTHILIFITRPNRPHLLRFPRVRALFLILGVCIGAFAYYGWIVMQNFQALLASQEYLPTRGDARIY